MLTICGRWTKEKCDHQGDTASASNTAGPRKSIYSSVSFLVTGLFLVEGGSVTLEPSVGLRVPPARPLACPCRVDYPLGSLNLALTCKYILPVITYFVWTPLKLCRVPSHDYPNKIVRPGPPGSEVSVVPGTPDIDSGVLERRGESLILYMRSQLFVPCTLSLHQPASPFLRSYPVLLSRSVSPVDLFLEVVVNLG